jgi:hypothetical protein
MVSKFFKGCISRASTLAATATITPMVIGALATAGVVAPGLGQSSARATFNSGIVDLQWVSDNTSNGSGGFTPGPTASGSAVIGSSGDVWNQILGQTNNDAAVVSDQALYLTDGSTSSGATFTEPINFNLYESSGSVFTPNPDPNLFGSMLVQYGSGGYFAAIGGLNTSLTYDLYLYSENNGNDSNNGQTTFTVTGSTTLTDIVNPASGSSFASGVNYYEFTLAPASDGTIAMSMAKSGGNTGAPGGISGLQITPAVPEPATLGLMAVLGTGLLLVGRKRKSA